ncbi:spermine oxidase-like [Anopheles nili]|uniref:spermine oxidase-like n=1 Tax=Anopheles nili TaxID=185578 RepID=UPI00237BFEF5|nr:spermine oxidase-like [Anopheles nili]
MSWLPLFSRLIAICWLAVATFDSVDGAEHPRVIIVGAGAAGIAAASRLYRGGITNILLLEASQRVGGRVHTRPFGDGIVDLGAQWCHGEQGNVVYELASVYPDLLKSSVVLEDIKLIRSDGTPVPDALVTRLTNLTEHINELDERKTFAGSLGEFFTQKYWHILQTDEAFGDVSAELAEQFLTYHHDQLRGYEAYESWFEVSAGDADKYEESEGNQALAWNSVKGFSTILDIVSGNYPNSVNETLTPVPLDDIINYGRFVSNIHWIQTPNENVVVTTEDGSRYEADHVISTVSLGVLKENHHTMFTPALPPVNQRAITGIYFGMVNKVFLLFDTPIPDGLPSTVQLLWNKPDLDALRKSKHSWAESVSTLFRVDHQPNVLAAWLVGMEGGRAELLPDEVIQEGVLHLLGMFAKDFSFGTIEDVLRSDWSSNRLFRGSYSSRSMTTDKMRTGPQDLANPLNNASNEPVVLFAGEATSLKRYSTVHGAIESGFREADRLLELYQ